MTIEDLIAELVKINRPSNAPVVVRAPNYYGKVLDWDDISIRFESGRVIVGIERPFHDPLLKQKVKTMPTAVKVGRSVKKSSSLSDLEPIGDRIVVRRDFAETQTPGGIVLPEMAKDKPQHGVVIAVGPGLSAQTAVTKVFANLDKASAAGCTTPVVDPPRLRMQVKVGDRVIIPAYSDTIKVDGAELVILRESDVLAILR